MQNHSSWCCTKITSYRRRRIEKSDFVEISSSPPPPHYTDKKQKKIFLIYFMYYIMEFRRDRLQSQGVPNIWGNAKIFSHRWVCNRSLLNFLKMRTIFFSFYQCTNLTFLLLFLLPEKQIETCLFYCTVLHELTEREVEPMKHKRKVPCLVCNNLRH